MISVSCGYENGKQIRKTRSFTPPRGLSPKREREVVESFAAEFERSVKGGAVDNHEKVTFKRFYYDYFCKNHLGDLKPKTRSGYEIIAESILIPYFGNMLLGNITSLTICQWLSSMKRCDGRPGELSRTTKAIRKRTLSAILGKAYEWNFINENPCERVKVHGYSQPAVQALQIEDVMKIIKKLPEYPDLRARLFFIMDIELGLRLGEIAGLEWRDVCWDSKMLIIQRTSQYLPGEGMVEGTPKSQSSNRVIPIPDSLIKLLQEYRTWQNQEINRLGELYIGKIGEEGRLFTTAEGKPIYDSTFRSWLNKILTFCEVPHVTVHGLRHTFASLSIASGADARSVAAVLGHSSPSLVMNTYANPQDAAKKKVISTIDSILNPDPS